MQRGALLTLAGLLALTACEASSARRLLGATCSGNSECATGVCGGGECLNPDLDSDSDGLLNRLEAALRTNPALSDSDQDGKDDLAEVVSPGSPRNADGDGAIDAIESAVRDRDRDCIPDELDPFDDQPAIDLVEVANQACCCDGLCSELETDQPVLAECIPNQPQQIDCGRTSDCPLGQRCEAPPGGGLCVTPGALGMMLGMDMPPVVNCRTDGDCPELTVCDAQGFGGQCVGSDGLAPTLPPTLTCSQPGAMMPVRLRPECAEVLTTTPAP